jgi:hypothetical protein
MQYLIILAIFLVPIASIITIKGTIVWYPQLLALQMMGAICYASMFWRFNKFISLFLAYLAFSYIYVASASPRTQMCLLIGYLAIAVTLAVSKLKELKWIYIALIGMSILSVAYSVLQSFGIDPIFVQIGGGKEDVVSFMGSHNQLGIYSCANAFWSPFLIPIAVIPIFFAKCNSALIGLIAGSLIYGYFLYGFKKVGTFLFAILLLLIPWWSFNHKSSAEILERFSIWKLTIHQLIEGKIETSDLSGNKSVIQGSPFTGFGLGNFFVYSPYSQYEIWGLTKTDPSKIEHFYEHAHNDLVEAIYEFGYVGFTIIIFCIISVVMVFIKSSKTSGVVLTFSSLVAQSVSSLSVYIFHAPVSLFMFCLTLGLFYAEVNKNGTNQSKIKPITT